MQTEVLIVGGGLSGLHTAYELHKKGIRFLLVEARRRLGGRILSRNPGATEYDSTKAAYDLGPSWFWPGQIQMQSLIDELNLTASVFMQSSAGDALYEDNQGNIQRGVGGVSMAGAYRIEGGLRKLVSGLEQKIPVEFLLSNAVVSAIELQQDSLCATVNIDGAGKQIRCKNVVLALPPRLAVASIRFKPRLSQKRLEKLNTVATWMAGHAKIVAIYKNSFWNQAGFSGDVISHRGPLQEIHDASSKNGELNALFGFISVHAKYRRQRQDQLREMAIAQLVRLFGESASKPTYIDIKDWAFDSNTVTDLDQEILKFHPANDMSDVTEGSWQHNLIWSGSESADYRQHSNGFLEGALEASTRTVARLSS